ncbi:MAG: glycosyltransferase family A protein [Methylacidiphilales bacterium]|nr:glycosyltransferase family A protein [Candidatus Methylacidiphilales bacterium]
MNPSAPQICIVAASLSASPNDEGAGGHALQLARLCLEHFGSLTVLYTGPRWDRQPGLEKSLTDAGARFVFLEDVPREPHENDQWGIIDQSSAVCDFLKTENHSHIVFQDQRGPGFRAIQARRIAGEFENSVLILCILAPSEYSLEKQEAWSRWPVVDALAGWCERYACEHADFVAFAGTEVRDWVTGREWVVAPKAALMPVPSDSLEASRQKWIDLFSERPPAARLEKIRAEIAANPPLVSVIIPYFNYGKYLPTALASIAASTYPNFEVFVVDDASTDEFSRRIFREMRELYDGPKYAFISRRENGGVAAVRNHAAALARGEYLVFFDSDNIADPGMLQSFVEGIIHGGVDCCTCYYKTFSNTTISDPETALAWVSTPIGAALEIGWMENVCGDANSIVRRDVFESIKGFRSECEPVEDFDFFLRVCFAGRKVDVVPRFLFWYRDNHGGLRHNANRYKRYHTILSTYTSGLPAFHQRIFKQIAYPLARLAGYPPQRWRWHDLPSDRTGPKDISPARFAYSLLKQIEQYVRKRYFKRAKNQSD